MNQLEVVPCLDSDEMAAARKRELFMGRNMAVYQSRIAVNAVQSGFYENANNERVDWRGQLIEASFAKQTISP